MNRPVLSILFIHLSGWFLFFAFSLTFASELNQVQSPGALFKTPEFIWFALLNLSVFYSHNYFIFKYLYLRHNYLFYFIVFIIFLTAYYFITPFDNLVHNASLIIEKSRLNFGDPIAQHEHIGAAPYKPERSIDIISLIIFVLIWLLSAAMQLIGQWQYAKEIAAKAEAEKVMAELAFLKAQINPHFLFNSLNNIYSLATAKSDKAPDAIMKLSKIMRYITDEVTSDFVLLENEVDCIRDYIELQRLRLSQKVNIDFSVSGDMAGKKIAPLILIPFVENNFKYGISSHEPCSIIIKLEATAHTINFFSRNKIFSSAYKIERIGIGIKNTRKRLELVYNGRSNLNIQAEDGFYTVELTLTV